MAKEKAELTVEELKAELEKKNKYAKQLEAQLKNLKDKGLVAGVKSVQH